MQSITNEEIMLLNLIKSNINNCKCDLEFDDVNFESLFKLCNDHSVAMLAFDALNFNGIELPQNVLNDWLYFSSRKMTIRENILLKQKQLTDLLKQNDVKYFVFKGLCAAYFYSDPHLRECGDIDFFVDKSDFEKTKEILCKNGFKLVSTSNDMHWSFVSDGIELEMHHRFWDVYDNSYGEYTCQYLSNAIINSIEYKIDDYKFDGPDYVTHCIILILHLINHIRCGGVGVRHVCDFAYFANTSTFFSNLKEIQTVCERCGIATVFNVLSNICYNYLGVENCSFAKDYNQQLSAAVLKDILSSGNFGRLNESEYYASSAFTSKKDQDESVVKRIYSFCQTAWPPCKKYKILLTIAPIYVLFRYFFRVILKKRPKVNFYKMIKRSSHRNSIYSQLNIFGEDL